MKEFCLLSPGLIGKISERLRALGDETRLRILCRLARGECHVGALVEQLGVAQASVSKHLGTLRKAGIVQVRRDGAQAIYSIRDESVFGVLDLLRESLIQQHQEQGRAMGLEENDE